MINEPYKRNLGNFLIKAKSQLKISLLFTAFFIGPVLILEYFFFHSFSDVTQGMTEFYGLDLKMRDAILGVSDHFLLRRTIIAFIYVIVAFILLIVLTHRIYGPIYAVKRFLIELLEDKNTTHLKLRKRDEFKEIEGLLNKLADKIRK